MSDPRANIEITASSGRLASGLRNAASRVKGFAGDVRASMAKVGGPLASTIGNIAGGLAMRGLDFVGQQAEGVRSFERDLTRLGIAGNLPDEKLNELRKTARGVSSDLGIGAEQILAGTQAYVDLTGDVDGATGSMSNFARIAQASGASVADVASATAAFKGVGIPLEAMEATFSGLITQGKAGAVSLKDFAGELAGLAPRWAKFNESTTDSGIAQLGAAFQTARQGFGSASEAATGLQALMGALTQNAKKFAAAGVEVFDRHKDGSKTLKTFEQILQGIENSKLIKDPTLMTKAMGSKEAEQTITMLLRARQIVGTGLVSDYGKLIDAGLKTTAVQEDLDRYMQSSSGRMEAAWERVKNKVAEALTPERIEQFANAMGKVGTLIVKLVDGIDGLVTAVTALMDLTDSKEQGKKVADHYGKFMNADQMDMKAGFMRKEAQPIADDADFFDTVGLLSANPAMSLAAKMTKLVPDAQLAAADEMQARAARERITGRGSVFGASAAPEGNSISSEPTTFAGDYAKQDVVNAIRTGFDSVSKSLDVTLRLDGEKVAKTTAKSNAPRRGM